MTDLKDIADLSGDLLASADELADAVRYPWGRGYPGVHPAADIHPGLGGQVGVEQVVAWDGFAAQIAAEARDKMIFPLADAEYAALAHSIARVGLLHPITVSASGLVLDGRARLKACRETGVDPRFTTLKSDLRGALAFVWDANAQRMMGKTEGQLAAIAAEIGSFAEERMLSLGLIAAAQCGLINRRPPWCPTVEDFDYAIANPDKEQWLYLLKQVRKSNEWEELLEKAIAASLKDDLPNLGPFKMYSRRALVTFFYGNWESRRESENDGETTVRLTA